MATQAAFASFNFIFLNLNSETIVETLFQDVEIHIWILGNKKDLFRAGSVFGIKTSDQHLCNLFGRNKGLWY